MKLVISNSPNGFSIPKEICDLCCVDPQDDVGRDNPLLVSYVEANAPEDLYAVFVPDSATDYFIDERSGYERVYYVFGGKIKVAF